MRTIFLAISLACSAAVAAQTPNRTPEQIHKDSLEMAENMRLYPELYRFNRAPFLLTDSTTAIQGYRNSLRLEDNVVVDSIHNNFHGNMPDTTTVMPYSSISVGGSRIKLSCINGLLAFDYGTASLIPWTPEAMRKDSLADRSGNQPLVRGMVFWSALTNGRDSLFVRLSINGKPVYDWKNLASFPAAYRKGQETSPLRGKHPRSIQSVAYGYEYDLCDTTLNVHDQLLIEIKESKYNWMLDRFNFTRVAAAPGVSAIRITGEDGRTVSIDPTEKKTLASAPAARTSR